LNIKILVIYSLDFLTCEVDILIVEINYCFINNLFQSNVKLFKARMSSFFSFLFLHWNLFFSSLVVKTHMRKEILNYKIIFFLSFFSCMHIMVFLLHFCKFHQQHAKVVFLKKISYFPSSENLNFQLDIEDYETFFKTRSLLSNCLHIIIYK